jgi:hypothetical protein
MVEIQNTIKTPKSFPEIWQPIASAPRDGTFVLTKAGSWQPCITHFATYDGRTRWGASPEGFMTEAEFLRYWHEVSYAPTEWMPLPDDDVADAIETAYRNGFEDGERHAGEAASPSPETKEEFIPPPPSPGLIPMIDLFPQANVATPELAGIELVGVAEQLEQGAGAWRACSGCHELIEGHPTGPWSETLKSYMGGGCRECGGIGAIWDSTDYSQVNNPAPMTRREGDR